MSGEDQSLDVLMPERTVTLSTGDVVTCHEMTFGQSARLAELWRPVADELIDTLASADEDQATEVFADLTERHGERLIGLIAGTATIGDRPVQQSWVEDLPSDDGMLLAVTWLGVHLHFFAVKRGARKLFRDSLRRPAMSTSSPH